MTSRQQLRIWGMFVLATAAGVLSVLGVELFQPLQDRWAGHGNRILRQDCAALFNGSADNHLGLMTIHQFRRDVARESWQQTEAHSFSIPLSPAVALAPQAAGSERSELFWRTPRGLPEQEIRRQLQAGEFSGRLRRPQIQFFPEFLNEDSLFSSETPFHHRWVIATQGTAPAALTWLSLIVACVIAGWSWGTFANAWIQSPGMAWWGMCPLVIGLGTGLLSLAWFPAGNAVWNTLFPGTALAMSFFSATGILIVVCRGATLATRQETDTPLPSPTSPPDHESDVPFLVTNSGFRVRDELGVRTFVDENVSGISLQCRKLSHQGQQRLIRFRIHAEQGEEVFRISDLLAEGQPDPLSGLLTRLLAGMIRRSGAELLTNGSLCGENWSLNRIAIEVKQKAGSRIVGLNQITTIEWIGNEYCLWSQEDYRPFLRLPADSENVLVLAGLLPDILPQGQRAGQPQHPFGRELLKLQAETRKWLGILKLSPSASWQIHEQGLVVHQSGSAEFTIPLEEITSFRVEQSPNTVTLTCTTTQEPARLSLTVPVSPGTLKSLEFVEHHLSKPISNGLLQRLVSCMEVDWTSQICLQMTQLIRRQDGVEERLSLSRIQHVSLGDEEICLEIADRHPLRIPRDAPNAMAGLELLKHVRAAFSEACQAPVEEEYEREYPQCELDSSMAEPEAVCAVG